LLRHFRLGTAQVKVDTEGLVPAFVDLYYRVVRHRESIIATLTNDGLSNALVESTNTKLRLLTRVAYGFRSTDNLIALCLLDRGGYCPPVPGRSEAA
jgi:transposase